MFEKNAKRNECNIAHHKKLIKFLESNIHSSTFSLFFLWKLKSHETENRSNITKLNLSKKLYITSFCNTFATFHKLHLFSFCSLNLHGNKKYSMVTLHRRDESICITLYITLHYPMHSNFDNILQEFFN